MSEKNPRPDRGVRTDDAERPGTGPAEAGAEASGSGTGPSESGAWSSKPEVDGKRAAAPSLGLRGTPLFLWRQTDLHADGARACSCALAVAAIPGSLYPRRGVNPALTEQFLEENGRWGEILDTLGFFEVFSSPWFSAIYLLLFISLIGRIVPRVGVHLRQPAREAAPHPLPPDPLHRVHPPRVARLAGRLPDRDGPSQPAPLPLPHRGARGEGRPLRQRRAGALRETGNLLFHIALVGVLVCIAGGTLTSYRGQVTVVEGGGFANSLTQYDSFESGAWFDENDLPDFRFTLEDFRATYVQPGEAGKVGEPRSFEADVQVTTPGQEQESRTVQVNKPLHVPGASMYLLGNGYAPEITLTDPEGTVVAEGPLITVPMGDTNYTSQVVLKAPDAQPEQTAVVGFFLPTGTIDEQGPRSLYPDALDPRLALTVYQGDLGLDSGVPQNAYEVDLTTLTQVPGEDGDPVLIRLYPGQEYSLADGTTVSFDGLKRYAAFDIAHNPFERWILISALVAVGGLILSLFVPRRRLWVRVREQGGTTVLEVAGLARSDDPALADDVKALASRLSEAHDGQRLPDAAPSGHPEADASGGPREGSAQ
ncbi:cytochrome c biogenesis protein ResB [Brachybacterium sp. GPGPB12]|uniref:cytochrome c biogenesis protein ResB n=1 Tax=Brachybacterium sp. GPGPB12 TaxID=3023517 RepID=UPI00313459C5